MSSITTTPASSGSWNSASTATPSGLTGPPTKTESSRSVTGASWGTASPTVESERRLRISPIAPSSLCAVTKTTVRRKFGSRMDGEAMRNWPVRESMGLSLPFRRETIQDPPRIQRLARVGTAVDQDEVAGSRIHRQPRLDGVISVVALDQVVDVAKVPIRREGAPLALESLRLHAVLGGQLVACLGEPLLVKLDLQLDRAQAAHPGERPAERGDLRLGVGSEVS